MEVEEGGETEARIKPGLNRDGKASKEGEETNVYVPYGAPVPPLVPRV
jgi:hypothetical protein